MTDILTIKRTLADRAQAVAEMLLPAGRKEGAEWRVGSVDGEKGKSLGVHLAGPKAGVWSDFATGETGDLLDLWCRTRSMKLIDALDAARSYLGLERPQPYREAPQPVYVRPQPPKCTKPRGRVMDYLTEDRNIPGEVLDRYKIGERGDVIVFPFLLPNGTLVLAKERKAVDKADCIPTSKDFEKILFGWQAIPDDAREVTITEGEIDALSAYALGWPALSVPLGGGGKGKQNWIEREYERLERFERIYLALDMDKGGNEAAEEIANRLGRHRCVRVMLPYKDANECLVNGLGKAEAAKFWLGATTLDPEGLKRPTAFLGEVQHLFWPMPGEHVGYATPYGKLSGKMYFRPGEVTLWSGATGAGKSQVLSDCVVDWVQQGARVCVASFEMKPKFTLKRMVKQTVNVDRPTSMAIERSLVWLDQGVLLFDFVGKKGWPVLREIFDYARQKYGCDNFVVDSLMRMGIGKDDYAGQEAAVYEMVQWAIANNVHLHLVAHSRKGGKDSGVPETEDIGGAMEIGGNAFNVITIWRNRKFEEALEKATTDEERREIQNEPGVVLNIAKQRNGDFEGKVGLWFDKETYRYRSSHDASGWRTNRVYLEPLREAAE